LKFSGKYLVDKVFPNHLCILRDYHTGEFEYRPVHKDHLRTLKGLDRPEWYFPNLKFDPYNVDRPAEKRHAYNRSKVNTQESREVMDEADLEGDEARVSTQTQVNPGHGPHTEDSAEGVSIEIPNDDRVSKLITKIQSKDKVDFEDDNNTVNEEPIVETPLTDSNSVNDDPSRNDSQDAPVQKDKMSKIRKRLVSKAPGAQPSTANGKEPLYNLRSRTIYRK